MFHTSWYALQKWVIISSQCLFFKAKRLPESMFQWITSYEVFKAGYFYSSLSIAELIWNTNKRKSHHQVIDLRDKVCERERELRTWWTSFTVYTWKQLFEVGFNAATRVPVTITVLYFDTVRETQKEGGWRSVASLLSCFYWDSSGGYSNRMRAKGVNVCCFFVFKFSCSYHRRDAPGVSPRSPSARPAVPVWPPGRDRQQITGGQVIPKRVQRKAM